MGFVQSVEGLHRERLTSSEEEGAPSADCPSDSSCSNSSSVGPHALAYLLTKSWPCLPAQACELIPQSQSISTAIWIQTHRCSACRGVRTHRPAASVLGGNLTCSLFSVLLCPPSFCVCADLFLPLYSASVVYFSTPFQLYYYLISGRIILPFNSSSKLILDLLFSHVNFMTRLTISLKIQLNFFCNCFEFVD